jgi:hypothetical protein
MEATMSKAGPSEKALERKIWGRVFEDGLWDLYVGTLFINAVFWIAMGELGFSLGNSSVNMIVVLVMALAVFKQAKKRITGPRVGFFEIQKKRTRNYRLIGVLSVAVTVTLVVMTILKVGGMFPEGISFLFVLFAVLALKGVVLFCLGAHFWGVERFYGYALLLLTGYLGAEVLVATRGIPRIWDLVGMLALPAIAMLPVGATLLVRFLRNYPIQEAQ